MDMFTPATPETESPEGHEEELAAGETSEQQQEEQHEEQLEQEQEEVHSEEEQPDPEPGHSEELLAGKYKSPQDLENAYLELQRKFTTQRMEQKAAPQTQQQPIQPTNQDTVDLNDPDAVITAINRDPKGTIALIAQQAYQQARTIETQEQQFNRGIDEVAQAYGEQMKTDQDLDTYFGKVAEVCKELGVSAAKPSPRVLKMAAQELWGDPKAQTNAQLYAQAKTAAREEMTQTRQNKVGLGAPNGAKVQEVPKTEADSIRESIVAASRSGGMFG